jgi:RNA polymerase sigma-70 factor, ECF subfamily
MSQSKGQSDTPEFQAALVEVLPHLRAFARSLTRRGEQADDLVNDTVVRAMSAADQFQPGTNFKAWMFTILRNLFYNQIRKTRGTIPLEDTEAALHSVPASQESMLEFSDFQRAFWQLSPDQREVLILVGASGLTYEEASEVCDSPIGTIKSRVSRARSELLRLLSGDGVKAMRTDSPSVAGTGAASFLDGEMSAGAAARALKRSS